MLRAKTSSNVVEVYTKFDGKKNSYIVMEYCHNGDLSHYLSPAPFVEEQKAKELFKIILKGVNECHQLGICHRDLKMENIFVDKNGELKIADFGVSEFFDDSLDGLLSSYCGTASYMAPEMIRGYLGDSIRYDGTKSDNWSLGIILFELLTGKRPYPAFEWRILSNLIEKKSFAERLPAEISLSQECLHLLGRLLEKDPKQRATLEEVLRHPWLTAKKRDEKVAQHQAVQTTKLVADEQVTRPSQDVRVKNGNNKINICIINGQQDNIIKIYPNGHHFQPSEWWE